MTVLQRGAGSSARRLSGNQRVGSRIGGDLAAA